MFTLFVFLFVIIEFMYVVNTKRMIQSGQELIDGNKLHKGKKYTEFSEEYKNAILTGCFRASVVMIVTFGGLLTEQWVLWLTLLSFNIVVVGPLGKFLKRKEMTLSHRALIWVNSILGLGAGIFHVLNDYHLHINLTEFVKNFF